MCRNIRQLHNFEPPASEDEVHDAALQFVRKVSGSTKPSQANADAFDLAVEEVAASTRKLLDSLVTNAPPKNREEEAAKRRAKFEARVSALGRDQLRMLSGTGGSPIRSGAGIGSPVPAVSGSLPAQCGRSRSAFLST